MSAHTVGSAAWYEAHPEAPSRREAEADAKVVTTNGKPGPMTEAVKAWVLTPDEMAQIAADRPF